MFNQQASPTPYKDKPASIHPSFKTNDDLEKSMLPMYWDDLRSLVNSRLGNKSYLSIEESDRLMDSYCAIHNASIKGQFNIPDSGTFSNARDILVQRGKIKPMNESIDLLGENQVDLRIHANIKNQISDTQCDALYDFIDFCASEIPIQGSIVVSLEPKMDKGVITTGGFNMGDHTIKARWEGRAFVDVLRTIAHELVHYGQLERGEFDDPSYMHQDIGGPIEDEANAVAGVLIKRFAKERNARYIYSLDENYRKRLLSNAGLLAG